MNIIESYPDITEIKFTDSQLDAFNRLKTSNPTVIFDSHLLTDAHPVYWDDRQISGSGTTSTYNPNKSNLTLSTSANTVGRRARQTYRRFNYQPGRAQSVIMTGILGSSPTVYNFGRIGLFDDKNGLFFESNNNICYVCRRSYTTGSAVDERIPSTSWNIDKMDGNGKSKTILDMTKLQIFLIEFQWLGVGRVRFGFSIDGIIYWVHHMNHANKLDVVYMSNPNLPLRYEVENTNVLAGAMNVFQNCNVVISEGGMTQTGLTNTVSMGLTSLTTGNNTNWYPLLAIRLKSTALHALVHILSININCTSTALFEWRLWLNAVVSGTALDWANANNAIQTKRTSIELATPTNATTLTEETAISSGIILLSGYLETSNNYLSNVSFNNYNDLVLGSSITGVSDIIYVAVRRVTGTTETFYASLQYIDTF